MTRWIAGFLGIVLLWAVTSFAQAPDLADDAEEDDGFLVTLIQDLLSGPGRDVRVTGISGVLSSQASIDAITVADADGVWLQVENVAIDWSRRALFLRQVSVNSLRIGSIAYHRPPLPPEEGPGVGAQLPTPEAVPFALPELPLQVLINELAVDRLSLGEPVLGQEAAFEAGGALSLVAGELATDLAIRRLDGPGGALELAAAFSNESREIAVDLSLSEPAGGVVATALDIEGRPAIELRVEGAGPLDAVDIDFSLDADAERLAAGRVSLRGEPDGQGFSAAFAGALAPLVPPAYREFFAGETSVAVAGVAVQGGGLRIEALGLEGAALDLDGRLELGADNFLQALELSGSLGDPRGPGVTLPVPGGRTRLHSADLDIRYGEGSRWSGLLWLDRLVAGDLEIEDLSLTMGGLAENLQDPASRNVTITVEGLATGVWTPDPAVRAAFGDRLDVFADAAIPPDAPVRVRQLQISGGGLSIFTSGMLDGLVYSGRNAVRIAELAPFSGLAGRALAGGADFRAAGEVALASGGFDLMLDGAAEDLRIDDARIDPLLAGVTAISGRLLRDETGFLTDAFRIANEQVEFTSTGRISSEETDIGFEAALADLALVLPDASGRITAAGRAAGLAGPIAVDLEAAIAEGTLGGRSLSGAALAFTGDVVDGNVTGSLSGTGALNGSAIELAAEIGLVGETRSLEDLVFVVGPNRIEGEVVQIGAEPVEGALAVRAPDIAPLAALALLEAQGAAEADILLGPAETGQGAGVTATLRDLVFGETRIGALDLEADIVDAFGVPLATASLSASDVVAAGIEIATLSAQTEQTSATQMRFSAESLLAIGTEIALGGGLERIEDGFALMLERLSLAQNGIAADLAAPAEVSVRGEEVTLSPLALDLGGGRLEAEGRIGETLGLALSMRALPLDLANAVQPALGLTGTLEGTAAVSGPRDAPDITFDIDASDVGSAFTQAANLPLVSLTAQGTTDGSQLALEAALSAAEGVAADIAGSVPLGEGPIDLAVDIGALPLPLLDRLAGDLGLEGIVAGTARIGGTRAAPEASFDVSGTGLGARILRERGLPPLDVTATGSLAQDLVTLEAASLAGPGGLAASASGTVPLGDGPPALLVEIDSLPLPLLDPVLGKQCLEGMVVGAARLGGTLHAPEASFDLDGTGLSAGILRAKAVPPLGLAAEGIFAQNTLTIAAASVTGPDGIAATGSGTVPLEGPGLDVSASGSLPLALANFALAGRAAQLAGTASFTISANGSLAAPQISGPLSVQGATFVDPQTNVRLDAVALDAALQGDTVAINAFSAQSVAGGSLTGSGTVEIAPAAGWPANLQIALGGVNYTDGAFISTTIDGELAITGPLLAGSPLVAGTLDLGATEISVAEGLGTRGPVPLEQVTHRNTPRPVARTLERIRIVERTAREGAGPAIQLDVLIRAPSQIFVRGRGLDTELGGELRVQGPLSDIEPVGEFTMRRGRLAILGQRIEFDEGRLQLIGNLDPEILFIASTQSNGTTAFVTVTGRVSSPDIVFSSVPELPQDEVLARILFNRSADQLSAFQLAQLAVAAAELAGAGGNGLLAQLRGATGLDDLDIITEDDGTTALRAGRYIEDNIYLDVQTNTEGEARATINLDITGRVTARGSVGTGGDSTIGIFYQRDY
ncbi:hypothetical protein BH23PSE1_BH23PSE1_00520 [soil metagenome]